MKALLLLLLLPLLITPSFSKDLEVGLSKNQALILKIPRKLLQAEAVSFNGTFIYAVQISADPNGTDRLAVGGVGRWDEAGWPMMKEVYFEKAKKKDSQHEIEFRNNVCFIKMRVASGVDPVTAVRSLVFTGSVSDFERTVYYKNSLVGKILPRVFTKALAKLSIEKQLGLLNAIGYNDEAIRHERFKETNYLSFGLGSTSSVYNSIRLNQNARTALIVNDQILPTLKALGAFVADTTEIGGVKLTMRILFKDFLNEKYAKAHEDVLEVYTPYRLIEKFYNLDITNQQLIDGSVVLMNGNRIQVSLTSTQ